MRRHWIITALAIWAMVGLAEDEESFAWSWVAESNDAEQVAAVPAAQEDDGFSWSWEEGEVEAVESSRSNGPAPGAAIAPDVYKELLSENLNLRKQLAEVSKNQESIGRENRQLAAEIQQLEDKIRQLATLKRGLEQKLAAPSVPSDKLTELESVLARANRENAELNRKLAETQARLAVLPPPISPGMPSPKPGSDLFRELEGENAMLKAKFIGLDALRQREMETLAQKIQQDRESVAEADRLQGALAEAKVKQKQQRKVIEKLVTVIPKLEKELEKKESALERSEQGIELLKQELKRREHRVIKAQRMAGLLDRVRDEVDQVKDVETRDMHYNLALIYAREGRFRDAEQAYLRALQLDPTDPDIHYNLGILYDEELKDGPRASMHYRKYLKLKPQASDQDQVQLWILQIETDLTR